MNNNTEVTNTAAILTLTSSSLSFLGGVFIIYTYIKISHLYQSIPRKLLVNITIADLILSSFFFMGALRSKDLYGQRHNDTTGGDSYLQSDLMCKVQSFFTTYGSICSFFWTDILAVYLFVVVKFHANTDLNSRKKLMMNIIGWIVPGLIVLAAALFDVLGEDNTQTSGPWCWIEIAKKNTANQRMWLFLSGKAYELLTYTITLVLYIWMKITILRRRRDETPWIRGQPGFRENDEKFWLTWIVLLVLRLPGTMRTFFFISNQNSYQELNNILLYMQSIGDAGQAFVNCIIYCLFDSDVREYVREGFIEFHNELWQGYSPIQ